MQSAPIPANEQARLDALHSLNLLHTLPEARFDAITEDAVNYFQAPISTISLVDADREWYKSHQGIAVDDGGRAESFCGHTILGQNIFVVEDTLKDDRFKDNPTVAGEPHIRFYAGVTLHEKNSKLPVGAFCIKDTKPRQLSTEEIGKLLELAKKAEEEVNASH